jgi:putative membrane-bound dehydrogenase-like protein
MLRVLPRVCWLWLGVSAAAMAGTFHLGAHNFTLPDGFEIELVAGPPLIEHPVSATFDEQGRLYVTESSGSSAKADQQAKDPTNRVVRFEAPGADGHFTKRTVFADKLGLVEGIMWRDGSIYVGAPPSIWKFTDTDGDGVADQRSEWYEGKTVTGCGNDIHGPFLGPEGWIYFCKGAFAEQTHEVQGGRTMKDRAGHIFRCRPDGSGLESIMSGGMDNPVGIAFTREGEPIFTATFLDLSGDGKRDGLGHAVYGGVFGKENAVVEDRAVIRTGALLPAMTHYGAGAPCGITRVQSPGLGEAYRDNLLVCLFNLHKVARHVLEPNGSTFKTKDEDFVVSDSLDFHPTDVVEDADGSLLILDTGGWYKVCCPTSQLAKPDVAGAIYRVRKIGAPEVEDPRGQKVDWAKLDPLALTVLLGDTRPVVVARATDRLAQIGADAVTRLESAVAVALPDVQQAALWTLARIPTEPARAAIRAQLKARDLAVRYTAAKIVALTRDTEALKDLPALLNDKSHHVRRVAAEGIGRMGDIVAVDRLLRTADFNDADRFLEHALTFAAIEIGKPFDSFNVKAQPAASRAFLIALSEMKNSPLTAQEALSLFKIEYLRDTVMWIARRHSEWAPELTEFFTAQLQKGSLPQREETEVLFASMLRDPATQHIATILLTDGNRPARQSVLRAINRASLKTPPVEWVEPCIALLREQYELRELAIPVAAALAAKPEGARLIPALLEIGQANETRAVRLNALNALPPGALAMDDALFTWVRENLRPDFDSEPRNLVVAIFARARLTDAQRAALTGLFPKLGVMELTRLLPAFNRPMSEPLARQFVAALEKAPALASCPPQTLREIFAKQPAAVQPQGEALLGRLNLDTAQQRAKLDSIVAELPPGDVRRGQAVFAKTACIVCHRMGYLGGNFGPDLTSIGNARSERDLLEAIVFPSASFVRSYEPMTVKLKAGGEVTGILRSENSDAVVLATAPGVEQRLARAEVADLQPGAVSLMPAGFDQVLSRQDLSDLVTFLKGAPKKP